jgi:threonine dehydratase
MNDKVLESRINQDLMVAEALGLHTPTVSIHLENTSKLLGREITAYPGYKIQYAGEETPNMGAFKRGQTVDALIDAVSTALGQDIDIPEERQAAAEAIATAIKTGDTSDIGGLPLEMHGNVISSGNLGISYATIFTKLKSAGVLTEDSTINIHVPSTTPEYKREKLESVGGTVVDATKDYGELINDFKSKGADEPYFPTYPEEHKQFAGHLMAIKPFADAALTIPEESMILIPSAGGGTAYGLIHYFDEAYKDPDRDKDKPLPRLHVFEDANGPSISAAVEGSDPHTSSNKKKVTSGLGYIGLPDVVQKKLLHNEGGFKDLYVVNSHSPEMRMAAFTIFTDTGILPELAGAASLAGAMQHSMAHFSNRLSAEGIANLLLENDLTIKDMQDIANISDDDLITLIGHDGKSLLEGHMAMGHPVDVKNRDAQGPKLMISISGASREQPIEVLVNEIKELEVEGALFSRLGDITEEARQTFERLTKIYKMTDPDNQKHYLEEIQAVGERVDKAVGGKGHAWKSAKKFAENEDVELTPPKELRPQFDTRPPMSGGVAP